MKSVSIGFFCIIFFVTTGCATIFKGSNEKMNFSSDPASAKIYINGQFMGTTPFETKLASKNTYTIEFRKEGFENKTVVLTNSVGAGWIILDVIFGIIPVVIDAATGNWYHLDQNHVAAAMEQHQVEK